MATNKRNVTYKCPFCNSRFNRPDLVAHIGENHEDELPEGFTPLRYTFNYVNRKPLSYHGKCTECGKSTPWDENKGRYDRQCGSKACHDSYVRRFEENMVKTKGTTRISSTEEGQKKMLANRKISGTYIMSDGGKKTYTGSYEKKALEFMDKVLEIKSDDILAPGPILEYEYEGQKHIYITDFYYQPYNLVIEVKDGGDNPNKRDMPEYRAKQIAKEKFIIQNTNYNYIRLTNNDFDQLLSVFMDIKMQLVDNTGDRVIHVNESGNPILEYMCALASGGYIPGLKDSDAYIVNYGTNHVFSDNMFGVTDNRFDNIIYRNKDTGTLETMSSKDVDIKDTVYKLPMDKKDVNDIIADKLHEEVSESFLYEAFVGKKLYTVDQYKLLESLNISKSSDKNLLESFSRYLSNDEIDSINESLSKVVNEIG